jgi:hypothetical protein
MSQDAIARTVSERQLLDMVVELALRLGWLVHHDLPALNERGRWRTAIQGVAGFPDLVLVRPPRVVFAELKRESGNTTQLQERWLDALSSCPVEVYVWRPRHWLDGTIERVLSGERFQR